MSTFWVRMAHVHSPAEARRTYGVIAAGAQGGQLLASVAAARGIADLEVGELLRAQGQLDKALERLLRAAPGDELAAALYALGLDFERKRQFNKAAVAFEKHLAPDLPACLSSGDGGPCQQEGRSAQHVQASFHR